MSIEKHPKPGDTASPNIKHANGHANAPAAGANSSHPQMDRPDVATLERAVEQPPADPAEHAQALVRLANAYWLEGRGPDLVGELASQARELDRTNRGAWHLWALAEPNPRDRVERWRQVTEHFPADDLARANLADNAAALAGAEKDYMALDLAIETYEQLLQRAQHTDQRHALDTAIRTLKGWRF